MTTTLASGRFTSMLDQVADPLGFEANDANLRRYVGNAPLNATDPSGLKEQSQGKKDEDAFRAALKKNGVDPKFIDLIINTARETPVPKGNAIGSHQICADWVFTFEKNLESAIVKENGPRPQSQGGGPNSTIPGINSRKYKIFDVPLGAEGNKLEKIEWYNKNWVIPTLLDMLSYGGPARNGSTNGLPITYPECDTTGWRKWWLGQIHTVYVVTLKDGSVWYIDLGTIQEIRADEGGTIDDLDSGRWYVTPATSLPNGWTPTDRTAQPSWEPRVGD